MPEIQNQINEWRPSLQVREAHREWIAGRALTLLSHYWREDDPVELTAAIGKDWADVLEGLPQEYIHLAAIRFQQKFAYKKPTPAVIYAMARELMPQPVAVASAPTEEPAQRERVTKETANKIMELYGFRPKKFLSEHDNAE